MARWYVRLEYSVTVDAEDEDGAIVTAEETLSAYGPNAAYAERVDEDDSPEEGEDVRREEDW